MSLVSRIRVCGGVGYGMCVFAFGLHHGSDIIVLTEDKSDAG
jgi:hypothetical protein